ncbi:hypothetical protein HC864_05810, partial [Candidatus Gracilibacteria bacterium]|nr:hypothetical protein [Candidatus Gracilibacteria bacterium]
DSDSNSDQTSQDENDNNLNDCQEDNDGDGADNCTELSAGTDPLDPNSKPDVTNPTNTGVTPRTGGLTIVATAIGLGLLTTAIVVDQKRKKVKVKVG